MTKKKILLDLDGVLNLYDGNYDEKYIPALNNKAIDFIKNISKTYNVVIFTSRNLLLASKWIIYNKIDKYITNITNIKEASYLIVDDRCINFNGDFEKLQKDIENFKVWYKK